MAKRKISFSFHAPAGTASVSLCGNFTNWQEGAKKMKLGKSGEWSVVALLDPGEYQYKFLADGAWYNDPSAQKQVDNGQGSLNSVRVV